jgi:hypothetical protein
MPILVIAAYYCEVAGKRTNSVDYQVRHFASDSLEEATARLTAQSPVAYRNCYGQNVRWVFDDLVATELDPKFEDGAEVIGFITGKSKRSTELAASPNRRQARQLTTRARRKGGGR